MCNCNQKHQLLAASPTHCCQCCNKKQKIRGKFGVAYVIETDDKKTKPCGWEVEFNDTPSQIENSCKKMMKWISCPPLGECGSDSLQCCQCQKQQFCACQKHYEVPNCCCNKPSRGQKMYFNSKRQCYHCSNQSDSSMEAQCCHCANKKLQHCDCSCSKCKCTKKSGRKHKEEHKSSKNYISHDSNSKKDRELRSLYTLTREEPRKGPDKGVEEDVKVGHQEEDVKVGHQEEEKEIRSMDYDEDLGKSRDESNEDGSQTVPDIFNIEVDSPTSIPPQKRKIKGKQLLKLIKNEHRKEMDAIHPPKA
ncbi:unnamed protein product [Ceutorhynchus assimilis]|uniref:Uncharacterized protein n=1 Tax=Ceutorhynchus assimilis TaxID=467358 RepID=A0A9N9QD59_9CUCU|nr:unnamed protein product [Ceutorhynchus assimilis]